MMYIYNMEKERCECYEKNKPTSLDKWRYSFYTLLVFILVVNPLTYKIINRILVKMFGKIAEIKGSPNMLGLLTHSIIFLLIVRYIMDMNL